MGENGITTMVIDNALHTSIIIVWQPSFNWSRVCLHTYPINRYCFSSSRDVVFEIFHASHCHYILLKKIIPQNNMFIFGADQFCSKETWLFWGRSHLSSQMTFWELDDCTHIGWCTQSSSNLKSYNILWCCIFWWPSHQSPLQSSTSFHIYQHTHYV